MVQATLQWTKYIPHHQTPKQAVFLSPDDREAFYGGAVGSELGGLLMALQCGGTPSRTGGYSLDRGLIGRPPFALRVPGETTARDGGRA